jgi:hypothetical protein
VNLPHVGKLFGDRSSTRSERQLGEALLGVALTSLIEVARARDAPGFEDLFEQGPALPSHSWFRISARERQKEEFNTEARAPGVTEKK